MGSTSVTLAILGFALTMNLLVLDKVSLIVEVCVIFLLTDQRPPMASRLSKAVASNPTSRRDFRAVIPAGPARVKL
jgi:hypothetical protein